MLINDTIAAISTPYGKGGIAVLRISGEDALNVADLVFKPENHKKFSSGEVGKYRYGSIVEPVADDVPDIQNRLIDKGMAVYFKAPHSFTGEDTVEISCHGGVLVTQRVYMALLRAGARAAVAGEFTKRAFINGKMKLNEAESLGSLLDAENDEQLTLALSGMRGLLSDETQKIYDSLCTVIASVYAKIDYPDEDLAELDDLQIIEILKQNIEKLEKIADTYRTGRALGEGVDTVICGRTNAGKSSVYNRIVGRDAAIVTDIEGTTRDVLKERTRIGKVAVNLFDTAGLRESGDPVEKIGIKRAVEAINTAELVFAVFDGTKVPSDEDFDIVRNFSGKGKICIALINKSDLSDSVGINCIPDEEKQIFEKIVCVSARTGEGFDILENAVEEIYINRELDTVREAVLINARQHAAVLSALEEINNSVKFIKEKYPLEICCSSIEDGMRALGELDGRKVSEDVVSKIFSSFCVGK